MPISKTTQDLLPTTGAALAMAPVAPGAAPQGVLLEYDFSGCVTLIGPVQLCYTVNTNPPSARLCLKVFGAEVACGEINAASPCIHFEGDYSVAKWKLDICIQGTCINLTGQACIRFAGCKDFNVNIFCW